MSRRSSDNEFIQAYDALHPDAQRMFLESTFAGWANKFTPEQAGNVRATFDKLKRRAEGIPTLNIRGKQKQVDALFELLTRETKLAIFGDKNTRDEVLSEIIVTLTDWLNDIWSTVYEHRRLPKHGEDLVWWETRPRRR
ncbi:hypothetical protein BKA70DRAFT_1339328 [Coprinopsis sp. MPI-PUGE-AT-0042]|nr:hypothetical protein BKA70DRAFT_1339328 [Coprinopsis sp. MPI-PUGE-AT-0042]